MMQFSCEKLFENGMTCEEKEIEGRGCYDDVCLVGVRLQLGMAARQAKAPMHVNSSATYASPELNGPCMGAR
jgi:hypothetical protein